MFLKPSICILFCYEKGRQRQRLKEMLKVVEGEGERNSQK
jgi:hypothetical protein